MHQSTCRAFIARIDSCPGWLSSPSAIMAAEIVMAEYQRGLDGLADHEVLEAATVEPIVRFAVSETITGPWLDEGSMGLSRQVCEACLKHLTALRRPYKYAVTCQLGARSGAGLHSAAAGHWNPNTDGHAAVLWESDTVSALTTVFWAAV